MGREGSLGRHSRRRIPWPSVSERGTTSLRVPIIVLNPKTARLGWVGRSFQGFPGLEEGRRCRPPSFPASSSRGAGGKAESRPSLAAGKTRSLVFLP